MKLEIELSKFEYNVLVDVLYFTRNMNIAGKKNSCLGNIIKQNCNLIKKIENKIKKSYERYEVENERTD